MFLTVLESIARELQSRAIPYMVIGGQAVLIYGEPRLTRDIDITLGVGTEGLPAVRKMMGAAGLRSRVANPAEFVQRTMVLPCEHSDSGVRVDIVFSFSPYERQAIKRARQVQVGGSSVSYASLEDLLIHKIIAGRPRDMEDARTILLKHPDADDDYVRHWLREFEVALDVSLVARLDSLLEGSS